MFRRKRHPSVHDEPHLRGGSFTPDPAEAAAAKRLQCEQRSVDPQEERAKHSVFDEPSALPNRDPTLIDQDWSCRSCGYNLRGLHTGQRCPECGNVERYEPPRPGEESYTRWLAEHEARVTPRRAWAVSGPIPLLSLPIAIAYGFGSVEFAGPLNFVVITAVTGEVLKLAGAWILLERRSYLVRSARQLYWIAIGTALVFAAVQNVIHLSLFFPNASTEMIAYRWTVGLLAHALCTAVGAVGLVRMWEAIRREHRPVAAREALPWILGAILAHAALNACLLVRGSAGYGI